MVIRKVFFALFLTILTAGGTATIVWTLHAQTSNVVPLTTSSREVFYRYPTAEYVETKDFSIAVARDGSRVEIRHPVNPNGETKEQRIITNLPAQRRIVAEGLTESLTTTNINIPYLATLRAEYSGCISLNTERSNILGYEAVKHVQQINTPSGKSVLMETWFAPELGCLVLKKTTSKRTGDGPWVITNQLDIQSITIGEPDVAMFGIPPGFIERSPSQVMAEFDRLYHRTPASTDFSEKLDQSYYLNRK